jgi:murein DD-endopeptidase MepM/ murein hydrolase activator NlpD
MRAALAVLVALSWTVPASSPARAAGPPAPREGAGHAVPLFGELLRVYDAPENPFAPGHRGLDVGAPAGTPVRASATGVVSFAGTVAANRTVTVDHGDGVLTTYSFLGSLAVARGTPVERGEVVGTVGTGHPGSALPPHVHLSARRDGVYFDPLELYVGSSYADLLSIVA